MHIVLPVTPTSTSAVHCVETGSLVCNTQEIRYNTHSTENLDSFGGRPDEHLVLLESPKQLGKQPRIRPSLARNAQNSPGRSSQVHLHFQIVLYGKRLPQGSAGKCFGIQRRARLCHNPASPPEPHRLQHRSGRTGQHSSSRGRTSSEPLIVLRTVAHTMTSEFCPRSTPRPNCFNFAALCSWSCSAGRHSYSVLTCCRRCAWFGCALCDLLHDFDITPFFSIQIAKFHVAVMRESLVLQPASLWPCSSTVQQPSRTDLS